MRPLLALALALAACASDAPSLEGRWEREGAPDREWVEFTADGSFEVHTFVEYPEQGETFGGTHTRVGPDVTMTGAEGRVLRATVDGDRLVLEDGTTYVRRP